MTSSFVALTPVDAAEEAAVSLAVALLNRYQPSGDVLGQVPVQFRDDPRYLVGRLQQALSALLAGDLPPMDSQTGLLAEALADAISFRQRYCPRCGAALCDACAADWDQADRYGHLARALGAIGEPPVATTD